MLNLKDEIPTTLDEAIKLLVDSLEPDEKEYIKSAKDHGAIHFTTGMAIRNNWGLWQDTPIVRDIKSRFKIFGHGDDCSGLILTGVYASVKGLDVNQALEREAIRYAKHWFAEGINAETGEPLKGR